MKLSHIQMKVKNLEEVINDYRKLGFEVNYGRKPSVATNAFIWFGQDVFIELFSMSSSVEKMKSILGLFYGKEMKARWEKWSNPKEGLLDFALEGEDEKTAAIDYLPVLRKEFMEKGVKMSKILNGSRKPPEGEKTRYGFCAPGIKGLPFLTSTYTIPQKPLASHHPNGSQSIKYLTVMCKKEDEKAMRTLIGKDKKIKLILGNETKPYSICIEGFEKPQNEKLLHGMRIEYE